MTVIDSSNDTSDVSKSTSQSCAEDRRSRISPKYRRELDIRKAIVHHAYLIKDKVRATVTSYIDANVDAIVMDICVESVDDKPHDIEVEFRYGDILAAVGKGCNHSDKLQIRQKGKLP